jgi:hypothetical protein
LDADEQVELMMEMVLMKYSAYLLVFGTLPRTGYMGYGKTAGRKQTKRGKGFQNGANLNGEQWKKASGLLDTWLRNVMSQGTDWSHELQMLRWDLTGRQESPTIMMMLVWRLNGDGFCWAVKNGQWRRAGVTMTAESSLHARPLVIAAKQIHPKKKVWSEINKSTDPKTNTIWIVILTCSCL